MGEVLSEKVVKCLRLQNPGSGQVHGTMFGREEGVGPSWLPGLARCWVCCRHVGIGSRTFHSLVLCEWGLR